MDVQGLTVEYSVPLLPWGQEVSLLAQDNKEAFNLDMSTHSGLDVFRRSSQAFANKAAHTAYLPPKDAISTGCLLLEAHCVLGLLKRGLHFL